MNQFLLPSLIWQDPAWAIERPALSVRNSSEWSFLLLMFLLFMHSVRPEDSVHSLFGIYPHSENQAWYKKWAFYSSNPVALISVSLSPKGLLENPDWHSLLWEEHSLSAPTAASKAPKDCDWAALTRLPIEPRGSSPHSFCSDLLLLRPGMRTSALGELDHAGQSASADKQIIILPRTASHVWLVLL